MGRSPYSVSDIVSAIMKYEIPGEIPDEIIINVDQTPSKFVTTENVTIAETSRKGRNDKRSITVTLAQSLSGEIFPFQLI